MNLLSTSLAPVFLAVAILPAQDIPSYSSYEDYCAKNPNAPTCKDGKPIDAQKDMQKIWDDHLKQWCQMAPKDPQCKDQKPADTPKPKAARTRPAAPQTVRTQDDRENYYQLGAPAPRRTKGSPSEVRLGEIDWRLVPPHSDALIGMNLARLAESDLARTLIAEWAEKLGATKEEQDKLISSLANLEHAVISIGRNEMLAVMVGHLDDFREGSQTGAIQSLRISPDTVAFGSPGALTSAAQRLNFALTKTPQLDQAQEWDRSYQFWMVAKPAALAAFAQQAPANSPIAKIRFGVSFREQFHMDVFLDTADAASAQHVLDSSSKGAPRDLQASIEGTSVHYALTLDRTATLARFGGFMTDSMGKQFAPLVQAARQMAANKAGGSARPSPGKVVIEGLDDGPREVPVSGKPTSPTKD